MVGHGSCRIWTNISSCWKIAMEGHTSRRVSMRGVELILRSNERAVDNAASMRIESLCIATLIFLCSSFRWLGQPPGTQGETCHSQGAQGGASSTSEIASLSCEARKFGIHNGTRYFLVISLLPTLNILAFNKLVTSYEFEWYLQVSSRLVYLF